MNVVTVIWSMTAAASLMLAVVYLFIWIGQRDRLAHLAFSMIAIGVAAFAGGELAMMYADSPARYAAIVRWIHVPTWIMVVSFVWFTRTYLRAGRPWLGWSVIGLRTLTLIINFSLPLNINFRQVTAIRQVSFLGEPVHVAKTVPSPWMPLAHASILFLLAFLVDASISVWRRGDRRSALFVGGSMVFFLSQSMVQLVFVVWGMVAMPLSLSPGYLMMLIAMAFELSRDINRGVRIARQLHEEEERTRLAGRAADVGFWSYDALHDEIWASDCMRKHLGLAEHARLTLQSILDAVHPDDREMVRRAVAKAISSRGEFEVEHRVVDPGGQTRWIAARGCAEDTDGNGAPLHGVTMDITEQKRAESKIAQLQENLSHAGRISMVGQLASAIAHEINQPLGAILRNAEAAELVLRQSPPDLDELHAIVTDIQKDDQRAGEVIDRLRGLLRRREIEKRPLSAATLLNETVALVRPFAAGLKILVAVEVQPNSLQVMGDGIHLQQVILNLLLNAIHAVRDQASDRRLVSVKAELTEPGMARVSVIDRGCGISPDHLATIFDPFFTTRQDGMGMGLAISHTIIEAHGGRIWAEHTPGGGATVSFTVPASTVGCSP